MHFLGLLLQASLLETLKRSSPLSLAVLLILLGFSLFSWAIIFAKWGAFRKARDANRMFLRAFRKAPGLEAVAVATEQFRQAPLVSVFEFGYEEMDRQVKQRGALANREALQRSLQLGISEEVSRLEQNMNWLATTAATAPFIGLFGTVLGIINAFESLGLEGNNTLRAVAPGIAEALIATAVGLGAAIPAAIFYNYFGHHIREFGSRMEDFSLEFMNMVERRFGG